MSVLYCYLHLRECHCCHVGVRNLKWPVVAWCLYQVSWKWFKLGKVGQTHGHDGITGAHRSDITDDTVSDLTQLQNDASLVLNQCKQRRPSTHELNMIISAVMYVTCSFLSVRKKEPALLLSVTSLGTHFTLGKHEGKTDFCRWQPSGTTLKSQLQVNFALFIYKVLCVW